MSSAQSKCAGIDSSATELVGGEAEDGGHEMLAVSVGDPLLAVKDVGGFRAARSWLNWGELGWIGHKWGCFNDSGSVCCCFGGIACGSEWGSAGVLVIINDVALTQDGCKKTSCMLWIPESKAL